MQVADLPPVSHRAFDYVQTSDGIEEYRLTANGLQVLLLPVAAAPVATFMVTYRVGSRNERAGLTGATHLLEHLMFKGTERFHKDRGTSIFPVLQRVGAQINATTWYDRTNYYELLPKEHLALAVEIEADRMRNARVSADDLASERTVVLNELDRGENESTRKLLHALYATAFFAHPYGHPTIGWRSDVERVTADGLRHFYDTYYWPDNATASVIGDFDRAEALDLIEQHFGAIPSAPDPLRTQRHGGAAAAGRAPRDGAHGGAARGGHARLQVRLGARPDGRRARRARRGARRGQERPALP